MRRYNSAVLILNTYSTFWNQDIKKSTRSMVFKDNTCRHFTHFSKYYETSEKKKRAMLSVLPLNSNNFSEGNI